MKGIKAIFITFSRKSVLNLYCFSNYRFVNLNSVVRKFIILLRMSLFIMINKLPINSKKIDLLLEKIYYIQNELYLNIES